MPRKKLDQRYLIKLGVPEGKAQYWSNTGRFVTNSSLARRFPSQAAADRALDAVKRTLAFAAGATVEPEEVSE